MSKIKDKTSRQSKPVRWILVRGIISSFALIQAASGHAGSLSEMQAIGNVEKVAEIRGAMPCGVAVSASGRIFLSYPRWGDDVKFSVAEIKHGRPEAFPNKAINQHVGEEAEESRIVSAQSVVIDPTGESLWIVDTGVARPSLARYGGPKLIEVNLQTNQVKRMIRISKEIVKPETYLNDVRFAMGIGDAGFAFITNSSANGGIIVVDLSSGQNWERLSQSTFTMSDPDFYPVVEAKIMMLRTANQQARRFNVGSDGIAVTADGRHVYFRPLTSRHLYSIETKALVDKSLKDKDLTKLVVDHGQVAGASDGLEADQDGGIYLSDYEHNAIHRYTGSIETLQTVMYSPAAIWPDSLSLSDDGNLYFTANQLNRQARFNNGVDKRIQPYAVFRLQTHHHPIRQGAQHRQVGGSHQ